MVIVPELVVTWKVPTSSEQVPVLPFCPSSWPFVKVTENVAAPPKYPVPCKPPPLPVEVPVPPPRNVTGCRLCARAATNVMAANKIVVIPLIDLIRLLQCCK